MYEPQLKNKNSSFILDQKEYHCKSDMSLGFPAKRKNRFVKILHFSRNFFLQSFHFIFLFLSLAKNAKKWKLCKKKPEHFAKNTEFSKQLQNCEKIRNFAKTFTKCDWKFSHFFVVHWKPYMSLYQWRVHHFINEGYVTFINEGYVTFMNEGYVTWYYINQCEVDAPQCVLSVSISFFLISVIWLLWLLWNLIYHRSGTQLCLDTKPYFFRNLQILKIFWNYEHFVLK